jgi:hypothetical protein
MVAELDDHLAAPYQKKLVLVLMVMPRENAGKLYEFEFLAVQLGHHLGTPVLLDERELFGERGFHYVMR